MRREFKQVGNIVECNNQAVITLKGQSSSEAITQSDKALPLINKFRI